MWNSPDCVADHTSEVGNPPSASMHSDAMAQVDNVLYGFVVPPRRRRMIDKNLHARRVRLPFLLGVAGEFGPRQGPCRR